ncbi:hypothetical protein NPIL_671951 [Nephila pilipes]|uniref:Uncharacterized protein n=1 Tax=Nephila pilipes TaxID=299642 RepID=A0A8X6NUS8_NEPPI|nr:hypothetical protein NPIL_671951 [Nephila pilipes]
MRELLPSGHCVAAISVLCLQPREDAEDNPSSPDSTPPSTGNSIAHAENYSNPELFTRAYHSHSQSETSNTWSVPLQRLDTGTGQRVNRSKEGKKNESCEKASFWFCFRFDENLMSEWEVTSSRCPTTGSDAFYKSSAGKGLVERPFLFPRDKE